MVLAVKLMVHEIGSASDIHVFWSFLYSLAFFLIYLNVSKYVKKKTFGAEKNVSGQEFANK
jgi:hypothetical protein